MKKQTGFALLFAAVLVVAACGGEHGAAHDTHGGDHAEDTHDHDGADHSHGAKAVAMLVPASDSGVTGSATFTVEGDQVILTLEVAGATPGEHAFHLHEFGDCSAPDGTSAGGHWNPTGEDHGQWGHEPFHLGDVGNLQVADDGTASLTVATNLWSVGTGADNDVVGRSVIVHAGVDDFTSQPTGNAGGRIACGVIALEEQS